MTRSGISNGLFEDTQQDFQDGYIDTDWPKCPGTAGDILFGSAKEPGGARPTA